MKSIEILGPWLKNKGAELTLRSVNEKLHSRYIMEVSTNLKWTNRRIWRNYRTSRFPFTFLNYEDVMKK